MPLLPARTPSFAPLRRLLLLIAVLVAASPGWAGRTLLAQGGACLTFHPPCDPPPPFSIDLSIAGGETVSTATPLAYYSVHGLNGNASTSSPHVTISTAASVTLTFGASGTSASGSGRLALASGWNTIVATYTDASTGTISATRQVYYLPPPPPPARGLPIAVREPGSEYRRSFAGCAGCAYTTFSYSTPAYRSVDQDRSVTLIYSSAISVPTGFVALDVDPNSTEAPSKISLTMLDAVGVAAPLTSGGTEVFYSAGPGTTRISAQFDLGSQALMSWTAVVRNWWPDGGMTESRIAVPAVVTNAQPNSFGNGWAVAGFQTYRIIKNVGIAVTDGTDVVVFRNSGTSTYISPPDEASTLVSLGGGTIERRYPDGTVVTFVSGARMSSVRDRFGLTTTYTYDSYGRLSKITDPAGLQTSMAWSGPPAGYLGAPAPTWATITTPGGRVTRLEFYGNGDLAQIYDPDATLALYAGYTAGRMTYAQDRIGGYTSFTYDQYGGLASATGPALDNTDGFFRSTTTYLSREAALLPLAGTGTSTAPGRRVVPDSAWLRIRSARGDSMRVLAYGNGSPTAIVTRNAQGKLESTTIGYDATTNLPRTVTSTSGTNVRYDWTGTNVTRVSDLASGLTTNYAYNGLGQVTTATVVGFLPQTNYYSADTRSVLDSTTSGTSTTRFTYDGVGRVLTVRDGAGHQSSFTYQTAITANLQTVTRDGKTTTLAYDAYGRPTTVTDPASRSQTTGYDAMNRVSSMVAPDQSTSSWVYDDINGIYDFRDAKNQLYRTKTDILGRPRFVYDPNNRTQSYSYNGDGALSSTASRAGRGVVLTRDVTGRVRQITAGTLVTTIDYDTAGTWVSYANSESIDTVFTDAAGRATKQVTVRSGTPFTLTSEFGGTGARNLLTMESPAWSVARALTFGVDDLGRPDMLSDPVPLPTGITYNKDQQPDTITLPIGSGASQLRRAFTYGTNDLVQNERHAALPDLDWYYAYDTLDRLQWIHNGNGTTGNFKERGVGYDVMGRLNQWTDKQLWETQEWVCDSPDEYAFCYWQYTSQESVLRQGTYAYDAVGNPTTGGAVVATGNRLTSYNGYTMTYDLDGNMLTKVGNGHSQSFTWNGLGQLASVTTDGATTSFGYDGLGRRVRKTLPSGAVERYLYDGDNLMIQMDASFQPVREYTYYPGVDHPHTVKNSATNQVLYYLSSGAGHVTALVNGTNQIVSTYEYLPFGEAITATEAFTQPFRFAGRQLDLETGLYYNRARYYDPQLGRFISEDPIGLVGGDNQYAYVSNDPVNFTDPSGMCPAGLTFTLEIDMETGEWIARCVGGGASSGTAYLPNTTVTAQGGSTPPGAPTANFGNPCARGGICGPVISAPGMSGMFGGGGPSSAPAPAPVNRACTEATIMLALSAAGDIGFFVGGVAPAIRLAGVGMRYARAAEVFATTARYAKTNRAAMAIAGRNAAFTLAGSSLLGAYAGTFSDQGAQLMSTQGADISWEDFAPGFATLKAYRQRKAACAQ